MVVKKLTGYIRKASGHLSNNRYAILLTAIFAFLGIINVTRHEMWRNEIQAWLLARDSATIVELFKNLKYEGHPGLWHLCLFPLSHIDPSPVIMQYFHLMIATTTVYIFLRFSPFTRFQKTLFVFGYFPFYEYAVISRGYALGALLLFIFCVLFEKRFARFLWIGLVLFLLAHTSVLYTIITIAIFLALILEYLLKKDRSRKLKIIIGFSIILMGIVTSIIQMNPPADTGFAVQWRTEFNQNQAVNAFKIISKAFVPLTQYTLRFWGAEYWGGGNYIDKIPPVGTFDTSNAVRIIISGFILLWGLMIFLRTPTTLCMYFIGTAGLLAFFYTKFFGSLYHHGTLFLLFIASLWISQRCHVKKLCKTVDTASSWTAKHRNKVLSVILVAHLISGIIAARLDYIYPFSQGKNAADFIKKAKLEDSVMIGEVDCIASTVVGYLENKIYYTQGDRFGSYIIWDKRRHDLTVNIFDKAEELRKEYSRDVLLILSRPLSNQNVKKYSLHEIARFETVVIDEKYYLYLLKGH